MRDFLKGKTIFVASFVEKWKGKKKATLGMLPYLHEYLKSGALQTIWLEQPLPGSDDVSLTAEITTGGSQRRWILPIAFRGIAQRRNDPSKTYFALKARDLIGVFIAIMSVRGKIDLFIGVESVNALMGIAFRAIGKVDKSVYYIINYVAPRRYPNASILHNVVFHVLDRFCAVHSDFVWNQSEIVKEARAKFGLSPTETAPQLTVPMPIRHLTPRNTDFQFNSEVVYVGTIDEYFGVDLIVKAIPAIIRKIPQFRCHFVGDGPARNWLEKNVQNNSLERNAIFYGYLPQPETDRILASCQIGLAPYPLLDPRNPKLPTGHVFTDVGKPKIYLSAGLPVIMTRGIPFSDELERHNAGVLIDFNVDELAEATIKLLSDSALHRKCRLGAMELAKQYDATQILDRVFSEMASGSSRP
jgi:glycosyltransferase involved in cell wall biosynthesis